MAMAQAGDAYQFASQPRAVQPRKKFREPENSGNQSNIMWDRRVVRGNTYAAQIVATAAPDVVQQLQRDVQDQNRSKGRTQNEFRAPTPEPVQGRHHIDVQTDAYLEEVSDKVPEHDVECQTDEFLDRPASPLFIPIKTGVDKETQIMEGDLFDFELEVEPILDVLVGKTLEQSMMEVMEEEELAELRAHQEEFVQLRNAELAETQRMEEAERRKFEEKERRLKQERERLAREQVLKDKVAAAAFAKNYMSGIENSVLDRLSKMSYFYDPVEREVEENFMPWLGDLALEKLAKVQLSSTLANDSIDAALLSSTEHHDAYIALEEEAAAAAAAAAASAEADGEVAPEAEENA